MGGFGAPAAGGAFGGFGAAKPATGFGASTGAAFGASTGGGFGAPATGAFGAPAAGGFGAPAAGAFGAPAAGAFGAAKPAGAFGAPATGGFGAPAATGGFGAPAAGGFGAPAATGGFGAFGAPATSGAFAATQAATAPVQQIVQQVQPQTAISSWMADVQTNPYGNLKIKPSAHGPTLFSADPNVSTSKPLDSTNESPLRDIRTPDASYVNNTGTFRARAAGNLSAPRARQRVGMGGFNNSGSTPNASPLNARFARPAPSPNFSMSQTRGRAVDYSNPTKFSDLLDRSLEQSKSNRSQLSLSTTRSPATNKENNHMQATNGTAHGSNSGMATSLSDGDAANHDGGLLNTSHELNGTPKMVRHKADDNSLLPGLDNTMSNGAGVGASGNAEGLLMEQGGGGRDGGGRDVKWEWKDGNMSTTFSSEFEPQGLEIPQNFTVRKVFDRGDEYVEVRFLHAYDMASLGQCEGEGGISVAQNVLRFVQMDSPTSVEISNKLPVPVEIKLRANALKKYMTNDRDCSKVEASFRNRLRQEGWSLKSFAYDAQTECLSMEYAPT